MKLKELDSNFKQEAVNELIGDVNFKFHKNYTLASSFFEEAFMSNKNSIFLVKMGRCAEKLKEYEFALKCYKKTIQLNNNYTIGLLHIGWLISRLGDTERGLEYLKTAFELAPEKPEVISKYCLVLSNIPNSQEKSNSVLKKALALDPENSELIIAYAKSFEKMGLIDEAIATIEDAFLNINEIKENIKAIYILGMFYEKKNNVNKSIQLYKSILNKKKNHIPSLLRLGNLLCSLQEYTRSMKYIMYALQLNQNIPQANFCVGKIFHGTGDLKNAKKFYRICEEQDPSFYKYFNFKIESTIKKDFYSWKKRKIILLKHSFRNVLI
jgi:tetratricopeptide (TPR) repeat protein